MTVVRVSRMEDAAVVRSVVRRAALAVLGARSADEVALGASELATNLVKYAGGGEIVVEPGSDGVVVVSRDRGPGPPTAEELLADGVSQGGPRPPDRPIREGLGSGGAALRRLFDAVEIEAREGGGAVIRCSRSARRAAR